VVAAAGSTGAPATLFGPEFRISDGTGPALTPNIATSSFGSTDSVYIVWAQTVSDAGGTHTQIYYARSNTSGAIFSQPLDLSNAPGRNDVRPQISAGDFKVAVVWTDDKTGDVFLRYSTNFGDTFSPTQRLTTNLPGIARPSVLVGGALHLVWHDNSSGLGQIYHTCSTNGVDFSPPVNVTQSEGPSDNEQPRIAQAADGVLYLTFRSARNGDPQPGSPPFDQYVMRSATPTYNCAATWLTPAQRVSNGLPQENSNEHGGLLVSGAYFAPPLAYPANVNLHLAYWSDKAGNNLFYQRVFPNSEGWSAPVDVSRLGPDHAPWQGTIVDEMGGFGIGGYNLVQVAYAQNSQLTQGFQSGPLWYRMSRFAGDTWSGAYPVSTGGVTALPRAAVGAGQYNAFHVVWMDWRDNNPDSQIYYRKVSATPRAASTDLDANGRSDIVFRNKTTGEVRRLLMNGFGIAANDLAYTEPNLAWNIIGEMPRDITALVWRNSSTGQVFVQGFGGTPGMPSGAASYFSITEPDPAWHIAAIGDFDDNTFSDFMWWNSSTGQVVGMAFQAVPVAAAANFYTEPDTHWKIVASGDFAGSGKKNQLLWRNSATGQVYLMTVNLSGGFFTQSGQMIYEEPNLAWTIVAAADFNGDARTDILYRNASTGQLYVLLMDGPNVIGQGPVYTEPNLDWKVASVGDYDGDYMADILYRNESTGQVYMLQMDGLAVRARGMVYTEPNLDWEIVGPPKYFP
jgi:hypothetical protein